MNGFAGATSSLVRHCNSKCFIICSSPEVACLAGIALCGVRAGCTLISKIDDAVFANIILVNEPKILTALILKYLCSHNHGATSEHYRQNSNDLCHPTTHIWCLNLLVDLNVDMSDLHKVVAHNFEQSRKEAECEENLHRQIQVITIYDLLFVIVPN